MRNHSAHEEGCPALTRETKSPQPGSTSPASSLKLLNAYVNISGHGCYAPQDLSDTPPVNLPASHFLRPFFPRLHALEVLHLKRIRGSLTHVGRRGLIYHLWWHPHNFGANLQKNLAFLRHVLDHCKKLQRRYGMVSSNMHEMALKILEGHC
jgi:hypothetical protein